MHRVKENQLDAQLILSIFRHPLRVSGVSRPIIRRYNRMYTTIFPPKETPTGALYYNNLVIYTKKPFVPNLICFATVLNLQSTYSITITLGLIVLVTV